MSETPEMPETPKTKVSSKSMGAGGVAGLIVGIMLGLAPQLLGADNAAMVDSEVTAFKAQFCDVCVECPGAAVDPTTTPAEPVAPESVETEEEPTESAEG